MASLAPAAEALGTFWTREDPVDANYLIGQLTWTDGRGGITWTGAASGADPGGPTQAGEKDDYGSEPLPRTIHINPARLIQVDLMEPGDATDNWGTSCRGSGPGNEIRLFAGERLVGGAHSGAFHFTTTSTDGTHASFAPDPPGHGVCRLRIMPELAIIEAGAVLRLELVLKGHIVPPYGMAGDHRSVVRIPFFPDEELAYRFPSYTHGGPGAGKGDVDRALGNLGVAGLAISPLLRRPRRTVLLVSLLLCGSLAGCVGSRPAQDEAGDGGIVPQTAHPSYQKGNLSKQGFGAIIGQVKASDDDRPLEGAHVGLLGSAHAVTADPYGRFTFRDLPVGDYQLRIDLIGYRSFEAVVPVEADLIARIDVTMQVLADRPGARAHLHDYWGGEDERVLMKDVRVPCPDGACGSFQQPAFRVPTPDGTGYSSILPGTYEINVTVTWDLNEFPYSKVKLLFQSNNDASMRNWTQMLPRGPGESHHIMTTWEMDDPGHQRFSTWVFLVDFYQPVQKSFQDSLISNAQRQLVDPGVIVTLSIRKGVVPLEPAHADYWKGEPSIPVIQRQPMNASSYADAPQDGWWANWLPQRLTPPGTMRLDVYANASRDPLLPHEVVLRYRTSRDGPPTAACWTSPHQRLYCNGPEYITKAATSRNGRDIHWSVPVQATDTDPFYAVRTSWFFVVEAKRDQPDGGLGGIDYLADYATGTKLTWTLTVIAHKDPAFSEDAA